MEEKNIQQKEKNVEKTRFGIAIAAIVLILCLILFLLIAKPFDSKNSNKEKNNTNNETEKSKEIVVLEGIYNEDVATIYALYNNGDIKELAGNLSSISFYLDNNMLYYQNAGELYRLDMQTQNSTIEKIDYKFTPNNSSFSVVNDKIYYFTMGKDSTADNYAVIYDMKTKTETMEKVDVNLLNSPDLSDGTVAYFSGGEIGNYHFYSYNFETNTLKIFGDYSDIIENRKTTILLEKDKINKKEYCLYDKKNDKELFCVDLNQFDQSSYIPVTTQDNSILVLTGSKIVKCTSQTECNNLVYTLTDEEKDAKYLDILFYSNKLILMQGFGERCEGCYLDSYKYYDVFDNKKEYNFSFKKEGDKGNKYYFVS